MFWPIERKGWLHFVMGNMFILCLDPLQKHKYGIVISIKTDVVTIHKQVIIDKQNQNSRNAFAQYFKETIWKPPWKSSEIRIEKLKEMENNFYRWENDFSCIILSLEVFNVLPKQEKVHQTNAVMHLMDRVFNVLEALVDVQRAVMHRTLQT